MGGSKVSRQRATAKSNARKTAARKAAKEQKHAAVNIAVPPITENDLLAFQIAHFGDHEQPSEWFIDADTALDYDPTDEDDGLGYYEDGVKRTLTDEQIEMFRHSEMEMLARDEKTEAELLQAAGVDKSDRLDIHRPTSPVSTASSIEEDLLAAASPNNIAPAADIARQKQNQLRPCATTPPAASKTRSRAKEVPYEQRHKRKWEAYIDENDPVEGSLTHRRIVRELDEQRTETIDLDY